jgi:hypothetical protein
LKSLSPSSIKELTPSIKFVSAVATFAHKQGAAKMPLEYWPVTASDMSIPMQVFLNNQGAFWSKLTREEKNQLEAAQKKWPEYPLKIQELANKHGFQPPWFTLPDVGNKDIWDKYRIKPRNKLDAQPVITPKGKGKGGIGKDKGLDAFVPPPSRRAELALDELSVQALAWNPASEGLSWRLT